MLNTGCFPVLIYNYIYMFGAIFFEVWIAIWSALPPVSPLIHLGLNSVLH